jgi:hypothetical protein
VAVGVDAPPCLGAVDPESLELRTQELIDNPRLPGPVLTHPEQDPAIWSHWEAADTARRRRAMLDMQETHQRSKLRVEMQRHLHALRVSIGSNQLAVIAAQADRNGDCFVHPLQVCILVAMLHEGLFNRWREAASRALGKSVPDGIRSLLNLFRMNAITTLVRCPLTVQ